MAKEVKTETTTLAEMFPEFDDKLGDVNPQGQGGPKLRQEIDLGDGPMVFEGNDVNELTRKIVEAQNARFTRLVGTQAVTPEVDPTPTVPTRAVPDLTPEELQLMAVDFNNRPDQYVQRIIEAKFGMPFDDIIVQMGEMNKARFEMYLDKIGDEFVERHKEDYLFCPENAEVMLTFLDRNGLQYTPQNYEYAFSILKGANALRPVPAGTNQNLRSTAMSGYDETINPNDGRDLTVEEAVKQAETMPLNELKNLINSRKVRTPSW